MTKPYSSHRFIANCFNVGNFKMEVKNTDDDAAFEVKEPEFEGKKPESEVYVFPSSSIKIKKHDDKTKREDKGKIHVELSTKFRNLCEEFEDFSDDSTNEVNAANTPVPAVGQISTNSTNTFSVAGPSNIVVSPTHGKSLYVDTSQYLDDLNMLALEDITYSDDEEDVGAEADFTILETNIIVSPIPTTRVHKDHHVTQIIEPKRVHQALKDPSWIEVMHEELLQFKMQKVWVLVDLPNGKRAIDVTSPDQTVSGKDSSNPLMADNLLIIIWYSTHHVALMKSWLVQKQTALGQTATGKENSIPFMAVKKVNDVVRLQALVDRKKVIITEATIREALRLDDAESIDCLPNEEIFTKLSRIGYEKPSIKLAFYKAFFSAQWKFLIHTIHQCMSAKRTSWNEFSSSMASAIICLSTCRKFNFSKYIFDSLIRNVDSSSKFYMYLRFLQLMIRAQVGDLSSHTTKYSSPALSQKVFANMRRIGKGFSGVETPLFEGMLVPQQAANAVDDVVADSVPTDDVADDVPAADSEPTPPSPPPTTIPPPPPQELPFTSYQDKIAQALEIIKLKQRVKILEKKNKLKVSGLRRLRKVGTTQRIESSADTIMDDQEDASKQGEIIANIDADEDVTLKDVGVVAKEVQVEKNVKVEKDADVQGRLEESQAKVYHIDLEHADKVLSMQDDKPNLAELQKVIEVVTTAKLMTEVVTAVTTPITVAIIIAAPSAARRRKWVVIRDPEETATSSTIIHYEPKSKDKGKGIMVQKPKPLKKQAQIEQDEAYARELEAELNKNINWDDVIEQVQRKEKEDNVVLRYQALKRKPQTEAQARKNMMIYLKNMAGFKMDYFKGISYDAIRPIFKKYFNLNVAFLEKTKEQLEEEESRALKRISESLEEKAAKKQKLDEEVEELKKHLQIVPNNDDDIYTKATPLALKVPVVDYEIYIENNKLYYKIIRADGTHQLFLSFLSLLRNFDREDLVVLWHIVKEIFSYLKPKNFSDDFLLTTLTYMFKKPDVEAQV
nr:hypothetical protein [Tanacetum cinerariifolium]